MFESEPMHYRMRAEFRVWHQDDESYYIMFNQADKSKYRVDAFPVASQLINRAMQCIMEEVKPSETLRRKLYQVDFLSTLSDELLISLIYHKPLDDAWMDEAEQLKQKLAQEFKQVDIIGRAKKQKIAISRDYVWETLNVDGNPIHYKQIENSFTQPNAVVNQKMLSWARDVSAPLSGDLLELYCGNGNFSLALADRFDKVLATEIAKSSVDAAQQNIARNEIDNVQILRLSSEEFTQAIRGEREFKRLKGIDLSSYNCQTILVDPPRAGLDKDTCNMIAEYGNIIYISCNPETLARDLEKLTQTHKVERFALFDQFPYTHHIESGVYLKKR